MTLIDTPGFDDDDLNRTDKTILNELTKSIRPRLYCKSEGITAFVQCIMPNKSSRVNKTPQNDMNNILFILNSFDPRANPENHPRIVVIFNDVSIEEKFEDRDYKDRILAYKKGLKDYVKAFYLKKCLDDQTNIGKKCW